MHNSGDAHCAKISVNVKLQTGDVTGVDSSASNVVTSQELFRRRRML